MQPIAVQIRRDTEARWLGTGTILRPGEQSYSTDTNVIKVGDGVSTWSALPPISGGGGSSTSPLMTNNFMVAGGVSNTPQTSLAYSYDGLTWVSSSTGIFDSGYCRQVAWNGSKWLAVGSDGTDGLIASSPDGIRWTVDLSGSGTPFSSGVVRAAAWNGSLWVAVGDGTGGGAYGGAIATSADGKTWTARTSPFTGNFTAVASNGTMFVGVSSNSNDFNNIAYSYDGITWVTPPTSSIFVGVGGAAYSVAWNGQLWVVVGNNHTAETIIATSANGIDWNKQTIPGSPTGIIRSVAWNGSLWMACGQVNGFGFIITSPDGTTWTDITVNLGVSNPFYNIRTVSWNGATWFLGGTSNPAATSLLLTSADTITWTEKTIYFDGFIFTTASRRPLPYIGESPVTPLGPALSLSYYLSGNTGANTGPNAISVIGFNTPDPSNSVTGGALDMTYSTGNGVLTNTSSKTISVLVSGQVTTDNAIFDPQRIQPCLYVTKNSDNIVSSSVLNFNGSSFSTIVILAPNETISIRYTQTSPYDPVTDVSGVQFLGGQFSTRITFTQMEFLQGPSSGGTDYFSGVVRSSLIPDTPNAYDLGSTGYPFHSLHVTGSTIYLGSASIKEEGGSIQLLSSSGTPSGGPTGAAGPSISGNNILYGAAYGGGPPSSGTGQLGDTYVQTETAIMYKKEDGISPPTWENNIIVSAQDWTSLASSANGEYVVAVVGDNTVLTNSNYGEGEWTEVTVTTQSVPLVSITSDSTGQYLATVGDDGPGSSSYIYTSNNYGAAWTQRTPVPAPWTSITSSSDGMRLTAVSSNGIIATSTNRGVTWSVTYTNFGSTSAQIVNTSTGLSAAVSTNGYIYYQTAIYGTAAWIRIGPSSQPYRTVNVFFTGNTNPLIIATLDGMNSIKYTIDNTSFTSIGADHIWRSVAVTDTQSVELFAVYSDEPGGIIRKTNIGGVTNITNPPDSQGVFVSVAAVKKSGTDTYSFVVADQGQYIHTCKYVESTPQSFTWTKGNKTATWTSVAMVADYWSSPSPRILATATDISGGIYLSDNSGATFTKITTDSTSNMFTCVTVSGVNGFYKAAAVGLNDYVYVSTDGNLATWIAKTAFGKHDFSSISSLGIELLATDTSGNVWFSGDGGGTWVIKSPAPYFSCVTSNESGTFLAATDKGDNITETIGDVWLSSDGGVTWLVKDNNLDPPQHSWSYITYEPVSETLWAIQGINVFVSSTSGTSFNWISNTPEVGGGSNTWTSISSSKDITKLVLSSTNVGSIWIYDGSTETWTEQPGLPLASWKCSTISSDGSRILVGYIGPGSIWRFVPETFGPIWTEKINIGAVAKYSPVNEAVWVSPLPTSIKEAIDRMADVYNALYGSAVPQLPTQLP